MEKKILIVDDEKVILDLTSIILRNRGYTVLTAGDAATAFDLIEGRQPELVLLDYMMPGIDGGTLAAEFHACESLPEVPIVFLTAAVKRTEVQSRRGYIGGLPFLAKPVDLQELTQCLEYHLAHKAAPLPQV